MDIRKLTLVLKKLIRKDFFEKIISKFSSKTKIK